MPFVDVLKDFKEKGARCYINGVPEEDGGIIREVSDDYLIFEVVGTKERIYIPLDKITSLSKGVDSNPIDIVSGGKTMKVPLHDILKVENGKVFVRAKNDAGYTEHAIDKETENLLKDLLK